MGRHAEPAESGSESEVTRRNGVLIFRVGCWHVARREPWRHVLAEHTAGALTASRFCREWGIPARFGRCSRPQRKTGIVETGRVSVPASGRREVHGAVCRRPLQAERHAPGGSSGHGSPALPTTHPMHAASRQSHVQPVEPRRRRGIGVGHGIASTLTPGGWPAGIVGPHADS